MLFYSEPGNSRSRWTNKGIVGIKIVNTIVNPPRQITRHFDFILDILTV